MIGSGIARDYVLLCNNFVLFGDCFILLAAFTFCFGKHRGKVFVLLVELLFLGLKFISFGNDLKLIFQKLFLLRILLLVGSQLLVLVRELCSGLGELRLHCFELLVVVILLTIAVFQVFAQPSHNLLDLRDATFEKITLPTENFVGMVCVV